MISKSPGLAERSLHSTLHALTLLAGAPAFAAQPVDPALPAAPGAAAPMAGALPPPPSLTSSALAGASNMSLSWSGYFEALAILCFVLAALWALLWLVKRYGRGGILGSPADMRVESRLALGPKKYLLVVRCLDRRLVLGLTDDHISLLTEIPPANGSAENALAGAIPDNGADAAPAGNDKKDDAGRLFASLLREGREDDIPAMRNGPGPKGMQRG